MSMQAPPADERTVMTVPDPHSPQAPAASSSSSSLVRAAIWVAIGALIAAAIVCVVWVLIGTQNDIVGRAFLTIVLLAAFAGVAIIDAHLAPRRPAWFALASMATWVVTLLIGAVLIWMPELYSFGGFSRFIQFLVIVLILQLTLLHVQLYFKAYQRHVTVFSQTVYIVTTALVVGLAALLVLPLILNEYVDFVDLYWRVVVAIAILAAVGTALLPLTNALFAPKRPQADYPAPPVAPPVQQWPTYADGVTPLPVMFDGSPDWNAYYTGYPTTVPQAIAPTASFAPPVAPPAAPAPDSAVPAPQPQAPSAPAAPAESAAPTAPVAPPADVPPYEGFPPPTPGYEGFPPPPPLPPRP
jgi:hypothetical protein